ncbi:MAG: hypothetical protein HYY17_09565 [Planctomycetes bacterium]|nr:hypothetical protein [Planctomycetota bacterium]
MRTAFVLLLLELPGSADTTPRRYADWFPLRVGTEWRFKYGGGEWTQTIVARKRVGSVDCAVIEMRYGGQPSYTQYIGRDAEGVRVFGMEQGGRRLEMSAPMTYLRTPPRKGQKWSWKGDYFGSQTETAFEDEGDETVEILGKKTACRRVAGRWNLGDVQITMETTMWFAPGMGIVKMRYAYEFGGGRETAQEMILTEFKAGGK